MNVVRFLQQCPRLTVQLPRLNYIIKIKLALYTLFIEDVYFTICEFVDWQSVIEGEELDSWWQIPDKESIKSLIAQGIIDRVDRSTISLNVANTLNTKLCFGHFNRLGILGIRYREEHRYVLDVIVENSNACDKKAIIDTITKYTGYIDRDRIRIYDYEDMKD